MQRFSTTFRGHPDSVAPARHWLDDLLRFAHHAAVPADTRATAVLLLSELATNSVRHSRSAHDGEYTVHVSLNPTRLRVEVEDDGPREGRRAGLRVAGPGEEAGRGLVLVAAFADTWGPLPHDPGMYFHLTWSAADPPPLPRRRPGASLPSEDPLTWPAPPVGQPENASWN
ncbi:anti-sigma regulatory factor (Ser/Thr protein kinase) [Lipingzhangella halophila]|uniref:Anti-sigma regulatory factor (Ser/Thr protein kinase) n=1 Tax=Lipingzhangella halophila TaxID=1783352 RepID=A0A7W7RJ61_9ACTN|nr:ATP-binding protein [Lipingzhangella halophila]MBB4932973.1 anti-sigma regulatory factor (Ser/Thr protein kinase) [Lipingzhangella halophila]